MRKRFLYSMPDRISEKVINIFARHKKQQPIPGDEKVVRNEDGYFYVCVKKDDNGHHFDEEHLLDRAYGCQYIVRVMITDFDHPHIYNYKVPGNKILDFLTPYISGEKSGTIIEIDKYIPEDLA